MLTTSSAKRARNLVDISSKELARYWCKHFKKSKSEIEAAIAKVGNNAETVMKELSKGLPRRGSTNWKSMRAGLGSKRLSGQTGW
jgi:Protein of unknown function (DUF3606)